MARPVLLHDYLAATAERTPDHAAVIARGRRYSFRTVDEDSDRLAVALQELGIRRGDRVVVMLDSGIETVVALWATLKAGAAFVPISPTTKAEKFGVILDDCEPAALVVAAALRQKVAEATAQIAAPATIWVGGAGEDGERSLDAILRAPRARPQDPGLIDTDLSLLIYTSGSTGRPKGVMMPHRTIVNNVWSISTYLRNRPDDVILCVMPLSFDYGLFQVLTGARVGFTVALEPHFTFPYDVLKRVGELGVTGFPGVPTVFAKILQFAPFTGLDLSSLRYFSNTAAPFPAAHIEQLRELLPHVTIYSMYGLTECTRVSYLEPSRLTAKIRSVGRAMPNSETYIVDENGERCGPNVVGELVVRGASVMTGYWRRPAETAQTLRDGPLAGEKVLYTGDLFWQDEDGDLYFVGRRDDVFKCRGEKVSPREVEACLYELAEVAETVIVGVPDVVDGMAVKAYVVLRDGMTLSESKLRRHCMERLEPHLVPRFFEICESLIKTDSGKISASAMRKLAREGQSG